MNKYNSRLCCKHHSQRTSILIKFKEFIQKYWISILIHLENIKKQYDKELFMEIISRNTYYKIEVDILTIAFADSEKPNPDNYIILQREVDDLEYYYYEINSQQYSGVGGFKKVEIYSDKLVIYFQENQKIYQNSIENLIITYQPDKRLNEYIEYIFGESDCEVVVC